MTGIVAFRAEGVRVFSEFFCALSLEELGLEAQAHNKNVTIAIDKILLM
jgi:hypothetical protein